MYLITIKTKEKTLTFKIEDIADPTIVNILEQPNIEEVRIEKIKVLVKK